VETDPARAREGRLPGLRSDHPTAGPLAPDRAGTCRPKPDRGCEHLEQHLAGYAGLMQADAYAGFGKLCVPNALIELIDRRIG
jgi:transposase